MSPRPRLVWNSGHIGMDVFLSRSFFGEDQFASRFALPVPSNCAATERKQVFQGERNKLERFLSQPVHTSPSRNHVANHAVPKQTQIQVRRFLDEHKDRFKAYAVELSACGAPAVSWRLQRLVARRAKRYNPVKLLGAKGHRAQYEQAEKRLQEGKPLAFKSEFKEFQIEHWRRNIDYVLRIYAFEADSALEEWVEQHPPRHAQAEREYILPVDSPGRHLLKREPEGIEEGWRWFDSMGWYRLPQSLIAKFKDQRTRDFAFSRLSGAKRAKAYFSRGPDNVLLNIANWPIEHVLLDQGRAPQDYVLMKYTCYLRFEAYYFPYDYEIGF